MKQKNEGDLCRLRIPSDLAHRANARHVEAQNLEHGISMTQTHTHKHTHTHTHHMRHTFTCGDGNKKIAHQL